jgi:hypothetical protein
MRRAPPRHRPPLAATTAAQAPTVTTVLNNGTTQSRYDMVILGDGYQSFEQTKFNTDCARRS